jgi:hypothetical protein
MLGEMAHEMLSRFQLLIIGKFKAFPRVNAQRLEIEIKQQMPAVPNRGVFVGRQYPPFL